MDYFFLIIGFVCLIKGADFFVSGSSSIAEYFNIPPIVIGLTIVSFGTSMPEAAVSATAAMKGANGIAMGNVIGSNLFNLLVVLGASAIIRACPISRSTLKTEYPLSIISAAVLIITCILGNDNFLYISRIDGIILLLIFSAFMVYTCVKVASKRNVETLNISTESSNRNISLFKSFLISVTGILGIIIGGDLVVNSATSIALSFGIDQTLIGLTVVALGTSLPELVTSMVAAKKGETDIAVGNVIGSNIFNILFVLGLSSAIHPIRTEIMSVYDTIILIAVSLVLLIPLVKKGSLNRFWGVIMLIMYGIYLTYIIIRTL